VFAGKGREIALKYPSQKRRNTFDDRHPATIGSPKHTFDDVITIGDKGLDRDRLPTKMGGAEMGNAAGAQYRGPCSDVVLYY
jgi:hypothetical protein